MFYVFSSNTITVTSSGRPGDPDDDLIKKKKKKKLLHNLSNWKNIILMYVKLSLIKKRKRKIVLHQWEILGTAYNTHTFKSY